MFDGRQENFSLHARMLSLEAKSRDLLVQQGSVASGAAVALTALISRLNGLVDELVSSYNISEQELEVNFISLTNSILRINF